VVAVSTPNLYPIRLAAEQRDRLTEIVRNGRSPAKKIRHAQILLWSDQSGGPDAPYKTRDQIAALLEMHVNTVDRIRKRFVVDGEIPALERRPRATPPTPEKIDGEGEAKIIAMVCGKPPEGCARWTLKLTVDEAKKRGFVTEVCAETVRRRLKKNCVKPWLKKSWCVPDKDAARFVAGMERVLDVYAMPVDPEIPLVCMDEASKELHRQVAEPIPAAPGRPAREDYHYERRGTAAVFMFVDPHRGWRRVSVADHRTRVDWAEQVRILLEEDYPRAKAVRLVCDNLNTHGIASLYEAFPAEQARALARRLILEHTPVHGSWLNIAEAELAVLDRQCMDRRIGSKEELASETAAWMKRRNAAGCQVNWTFTTEDARIRLRHLYPPF